MTPLTGAVVSSEVILGMFLSHSSASCVTDDLHINSVWAECCRPREKERETERKRMQREGQRPSVLAFIEDIWRMESSSSEYHMRLS